MLPAYRLCRSAQPGMPATHYCCLAAALQTLLESEAEAARVLLVDDEDNDQLLDRQEFAVRMNGHVNPVYVIFMYCLGTVDAALNMWNDRAVRTACVRFRPRPLRSFPPIDTPSNLTHSSLSPVAHVHNVCVPLSSGVVDTLRDFGWRRKELGRHRGPSASAFTGAGGRP